MTDNDGQNGRGEQLQIKMHFVVQGRLALELLAAERAREHLPRREGIRGLSGQARQSSPSGVAHCLALATTRCSYSACDRPSLVAPARCAATCSSVGGKG